MSRSRQLPAPLEHAAAKHTANLWHGTACTRRQGMFHPQALTARALAYCLASMSRCGDLTAAPGHRSVQE